MSTNTAGVGVGPRTGSSHEGAVRLSVREIRETTWRALFAAGVSSGEAAIAASAVTFSEVQLGRGLSSVAGALKALGTTHAPATVVPGQVDVVDDPANRGLLMLAPLGLGLAAARPASSPVFLPSLAWNPVLAGFLIQHCGPQTPAFFAFEVNEDELARGIKAAPDRSVTILSPDDTHVIAQQNPQLTSRLVGLTQGVLLTTDFNGLNGADMPPTHSYELLDSQQRRALRDGLHVDRELWAPVYAASERFLVNDQ